MGFKMTCLGHRELGVVTQLPIGTVGRSLSTEARDGTGPKN